ncbi:MAG: hypothetical protein ACRBN8_29540 [Nannocystales bacterium]
MKRISTLAPFVFALPLAVSFAACDLEKEDGADTGAVVDDEDLDDEDAQDDDGGGASSAGTSADSGEPKDDDDSDAGVGTTDGDSDTDGDDDDSDTGVGGGEADGFAMLHGEIPDIEDDGGADTGGSGGDGESGIPEDALLVVLDGDGTATCEQPWDGPNCGGNWRISFTLMPDMQAPGSYDLFEEALGSFGYADELYPEGDCAWGGGSLGGTLVIDAIDDTSVTGHIEDSDAFDFDADVSFVAPRC